MKKPERLASFVGKGLKVCKCYFSGLREIREVFGEKGMEKLPKEMIRKRQKMLSFAHEH